MGSPLARSAPSPLGQPVLTGQAGPTQSEEGRGLASLMASAVSPTDSEP
jgi:hypothetical protein